MTANIRDLGILSQIPCGGGDGEIVYVQSNGRHYCLQTSSATPDGLSTVAAAQAGRIWKAMGLVGTPNEASRSVSGNVGTVAFVQGTDYEVVFELLTTAQPQINLPTAPGNGDRYRVTIADAQSAALGVKINGGAINVQSATSPASFAASFTSMAIGSLEYEYSSADNEWRVA